MAIGIFFLITTLMATAFAMVARRRNCELQKQLEQQKIENEDLRKSGSEFVANVSHELKTPLTSIKGFTETLRTAIHRDPDKAIEFVGRIDDNAERLSLLINDILELSKIESPNFHHQPDLFKVDPVLDELKLDFAAKLASKEQALLVRNEIENLFADRRMFEQALANLLENAFRYAGASAIVEVRGSLVTESGKMTAQFTVTDNGPGISPEDLPHIFDRFYRADKSRNRLFGGSGLGLAIVKHIVISHGGQVRVTSEPKKGAEFTLIFPL